MTFNMLLIAKFEVSQVLQTSMVLFKCPLKKRQAITQYPQRIIAKSFALKLDSTMKIILLVLQFKPSTTQNLLLTPLLLPLV